MRGWTGCPKHLHEASNFGPRHQGSTVDLYGPFGILGYANPDDPAAGLAHVHGTSMSAAVVSGAASMLIAAEAELSTFELKDII